MNKSTNARKTKRLRQIASNIMVQQEPNPNQHAYTTTRNYESHTNNNHMEEEDQSICPFLFDYVLVDAECSTDGSFKHIRERLKQQQQQQPYQQQQQQQEDNNTTTTTTATTTTTSNSRNDNDRNQRRSISKSLAAGLLRRNECVPALVAA